MKIIPTLTQIAKAKNKNALMVCFHDYEQRLPEPELCEDANKIFQLVNKYLVDNSIPFSQAYPPLTKGTIAIPYLNSLHIDIEMDPKCSTYKALCNFLEDKSGVPRFDHLRFIYITPQLASNYD